MRLIAARLQITQGELGDELGITLGATTYMLRALAEAGLIMLARFSQSKRKQGCADALTTKRLAKKAVAGVRFLARKRAENDVLPAEIAQLSDELGGSATVEGSAKERAKRSTDA